MNPNQRYPLIPISTLQRDYSTGRSPQDVLHEIYERITARGQDGVWIHLPPLAELLSSLPTDRSLPLFGIPFAVKDNIDVAGWPTTAACPDYSYVAESDATVVARLRAVGAIPVGKTNLDQFATGLVGARTPYPIPRSVYNDAYVSGGSSSGSAVAVAAGLVPFALGTDTAGSGRVPAAFNNITGLKPTRGVMSYTGAVPCCRSLDCVSILTVNVAEAELVFSVAQGFDSTDPFARRSVAPARPARKARFGVPRPEQLQFFGDDEAATLYRQATARLESLGYEPVEIDFAPFQEVAELLYGGPWVAERLAAIESFIKAKPDSIHPVVRGIIGDAANYSAVDAFRGIYELHRYRRLAEREWEKMDFLFLPTTGTTYRVEQVLADPVALNRNLGYYTNFVNLLDLCGLAVPAGFRPNGLPFGVTIIAPAFADSFACTIARAFTGEPSSS
jgi:allophanate hydrolase